MLNNKEKPVRLSAQAEALRAFTFGEWRDMSQVNRQQQVMQTVLGVSLLLALVGGYFTVRWLGNPSADTLTTSSTATLSVESGQVNPGDPIVFSLANATGSDVTLASLAPYTVSKSGSVVYAPIAGQEIQTLANGQQRSWTWNQQADDGTRVAPGTYTISVHTTQSQLDQVATVTVTIVDPTVPVRQ